MNELNFYGDIDEDGTLTIVHRKTFDEGLRHLGKCHVEGNIKKKKIVLTGKQRGYFFGYIIPTMIARMREKAMDIQTPKEYEWVVWFFLSLNEKSLFEHLKDWFIEDIVDTETGEITQQKKSIRRMSKSEFSDFLERVILFCAEKLQLVILPPDTQTDIDLNFERTENNN